MECKFCGETWHTSGRKGTRSRFSLIATLMWAFWIAIILLATWKVLDFLGVGSSEPKENPAKSASVIVVPQEVANEIGTDGASSNETDSKVDDTSAQGGASESGEVPASSDAK